MEDSKLTGVFPWDQDSSSDIIETTAPPPAPLPAWLANTFSTLTTKHPLRLLLPTQTKSESEPTPSRPRQVQVADDDDDSPFSFCAPADPMNASPPNDMSIEAESNHDAEPSTQSTQTPCPPSTEPAFIDRPSSLPDETFVPFSTPGPGSVASRSVVSDSMPSIRLPESTSVEFPPAFTPMPHIIHHERSYVNCAPSFVPQLQSTPAPQHCNASTETSIMYHDRENTTDNRPAWDPVLNHGAYIDIFSTPGPGCRAPTPVYFDSPTEHPSDSDPLQPGYELDSLDFRWEPFIQKAPEERVCTSPPKPSIGTPDPAPISNSDDYYYEIQVDPDGEDDADGQLYASINMAPTSIESPDPFSFAPPPDVMPTGHPEPSEQSEKTTATPERSVLPFFAPAPGIFISPLRGNEAAASPKPAGSTQAGDDGLGSQSSNDSIEDWDDTATD
ncbi:hypothetical protein B0H11DRAFT_104516 [Mycena galericulata]|nr:hypothetical protein B0H11DRAFT_104516 [Mycena galericulata]